MYICNVLVLCTVSDKNEFFQSLQRSITTIIMIILLCTIVTDPLFADGPLNVTITGPDSAALNTYVSLTCSANSVPNCDFQWSFNGSSNSSVVNQTGPVITFTATHEHKGSYTCRARNRVTNITMYDTKGFTVTGE